MNILKKRYSRSIRNHPNVFKAWSENNDTIKSNHLFIR